MMARLSMSQASSYDLQTIHGSYSPVHRHNWSHNSAQQNHWVLPPLQTSVRWAVCELLRHTDKSPHVLTNFRIHLQISEVHQTSCKKPMLTDDLYQLSAFPTFQRFISMYERTGVSTRLCFTPLQILFTHT